MPLEDAPARTTGPRVLVITGIMAAGKSTVAQHLAELIEGPTAHVRGDAFRRMIVSGASDMSPQDWAESETLAQSQLHLRHRQSAAVADEFAAGGFTTLVQDLILGPDLPRYVDLVRTRPLGVVVLAPRADVVAQREKARPKTGYGAWSVRELDDGLWAETPRLGLWLDTSDQSLEDTTTSIFARLDETLVT